MKKSITLALDLLLITSPTLLLLSQGVHYFIQWVMSTSFLKRCRKLLALLACMATGLPGKYTTAGIEKVSLKTTTTKFN